MPYDLGFNFLYIAYIAVKLVSIPSYLSPAILYFVTTTSSAMVGSSSDESPFSAILGCRPSRSFHYQQTAQRGGCRCQQLTCC